MAETMSPREVVARMLSPKCWDFYDRHVSDPCMKAEINYEVAPSLKLADTVIAALASSGDNAELAVQFEVDEFAGKALDWEIIAGSWKDRAEGVLAENAALKAERDKLRTIMRGRDALAGLGLDGDKLAFEVAEQASKDFVREKQRATEAERKLAEARGLLLRWLGQSCEDDQVPELQALTRAFLAQSADKPEAEGA